MARPARSGRCASSVGMLGEGESALEGACWYAEPAGAGFDRNSSRTKIAPLMRVTVSRKEVSWRSDSWLRVYSCACSLARSLWRVLTRRVCVRIRPTQRAKCVRELPTHVARLENGKNLKLSAHLRQDNPVTVRVLLENVTAPAGVGEAPVHLWNKNAVTYNCLVGVIKHPLVATCVNQRTTSALAPGEPLTKRFWPGSLLHEQPHSVPTVIRFIPDKQLAVWECTRTEWNAAHGLWKR
jgi:hypothetical protein